MFVNLLLEVVYQYRCVGNVAENQNASFHPGDDAFPEKDTEQPKQDAGPYEYPQIEIGDARQTQWSDGGRTTQYEEYIEEITSDDVSDGYFGAGNSLISSSSCKCSFSGSFILPSLFAMAKV